MTDTTSKSKRYVYTPERIELARIVREQKLRVPYKMTQEVLNVYFEYREGFIYAKAPRSRVPVGKKFRTKNNCGYIQLGFAGTITLAHRIIWTMHNGPIPDGYEIDHINKVRDDNRIENLRILTVYENRSNNGGRGGRTYGSKNKIQKPKKARTSSRAVRSDFGTKRKFYKKRASTKAKGKASWSNSSKAFSITTNSTFTIHQHSYSFGQH